MSRRLLALAALLSLPSVTAVHAAPNAPPPPVFGLESPGRLLAVSVATDNEGRASYAVSRRGKPVIAPSRLGMLFTDAPKFERNLVLSGERRRSFDETWEQPWGERRYVRNRYNELRVTLAEKSGRKRRVDVVFRAFDDGVGFRYEFPGQPALETARIADELTEFVVARTSNSVPATAWWIPAGEWNRKEYLYQRTPLAEVGYAQTPMTVRGDDGVHIAFHEAALVDYSAMNLMRVDGQRFKAVLMPGTDAAKVVRSAPFATPWRTIQIADDAAGLAMSDLILNLNEPNAIGDVSWFKPMKYVGIWWEMHLDRKSWASGPKHGATTAHTRRHIDFAAEHGFGGVLVEGWNVGWDGDWFGNGETFSFTEPYPDFDLEGLAAYARSKGVQLIGHHETSAHAAHYEAQLDDALDLYARLGVGTIKTGYVADGGQAKVLDDHGKLRYAWHEGQAMTRHHLKVVGEAAKRRIAINPHEPMKDSGLRRTWPNWVSREGARGMEYNAWGEPGNPPEHEAILVFTRMLDGPMDFTPGIFGMDTKSGARMATTIAKQLALYVVIYSPIQMAADLLEHYEANPEPFRFIKDVPVDWAETRVLNSEIGDYVTIARKDRNGDDWYLGAVTDEEARTLSVPLSFLDAGRTYAAQIYRDGPDADWETDQTDIAIEQRKVTSTDTLALRLAPGGGQAIRFVAE